MAYQPHTLVTISGRLSEIGTDDEIWQIGVRGVNTGTPVGPVAEAQLQTFVESIVNDGPILSSWFGSASSGIPSSAICDQVKAANIGADGKYTGDPGIIGNLNMHGGYVGVSGAPSFCSVAYTWKTARVGKLATHGRVYPPNYGIPLLGSTSSIASGDQALALTAAQLLLSCLAKSGTEYEFIPCVVSAKGPFAHISQVRVGNVYDVQRRRKDAVPETYVSHAYP